MVDASDCTVPKDNKWHDIEIVRDYRGTRVTIDGVEQIQPQRYLI